MESYQSLPKSPGVYIFAAASGQVIYVGKAKSLRDRVSSYFQPPDKLLPKTRNMVQEAKSLSHILVESEIDALILEANLIKKYLPRYNLAGKDDKRFPWIEISIKEPVPIVKITRNNSDRQKLYFGPYPTGSDVTGLLRFLRRLFPFVSQRHIAGRTCLRSHLGLCPCQNLSDYPHNLKKLIQFLSGKRTTVQRQLTAEMKSLARQNEFEQAGTIKTKLAQINYITQKRSSPWEYETNPNLISDRRSKEVDRLKKVLNLKSLHKIECFDISHTAGKFTTAAQIVFVDAEPEKNLYRRYKIRSAGKSDDYAALIETLTRRLKSTVPLPELFVIDGGKGQLTAVNQILRRVTKSPAVISLAKRFETIYHKEGTLQLPLDDPALQLLQRLRDEAHRFSRQYHFLLRRKNVLA